MKRAFLLFPFLAMPALAQENGAFNTVNVEGREVLIKKVTEVEIGEVEVEAGLVRPQISIAFDRAASRFNPLIHLRTNFSDEMNASLDEVK